MNFKRKHNVYTIAIKLNWFKYSDKGDVLSDKGDVLSDKGDVLSDKGDVLSDKGDVLSDKGIGYHKYQI